MQLANQVAIVTGAGQGVGRASAIALAERGAAIAAVDINESTLAETTAALRAKGARVVAIRADLGSVPDIDRLVSETVAAFGQVDILVNNAGVTRRAHIMDLTEEDWDRIHRVNAKGVFFCLQRTAREMIPRRSGRIINIASIAGKGYAGTSNAVYAASKGAVISLTKTAAQQLGPHNINVNAICPGVVRTQMLEEIMRVRAEKEGLSLAEAEALVVANAPLGRASDPEDIADFVVYLASPGARNITGQAINVDAGLVPH